MSPQPLLDLQLMQELTGATADSGSDFMAQLAQIFVSDARTTLARMQQYAQAGDAAALAREAHRLKGSSATVGAARLAGECSAIERAARAGGGKELASSIERARLLLDATRVRMGEFFRGTIAAAA